MQKSKKLGAFVPATLIVVIAMAGFFVFKPQLLKAPVNQNISQQPTSEDSKNQNPAQENPEVSLIAVGDIMLAREVANRYKAQGDINYPFLKTASLLKGADITFGNLENPITSGAPVATSSMVFRADPGVEQALKSAGFDILSLANNHMSDQGHQGVLDTIKYLNAAQIKFVGAGKNINEANQAVFIESKGFKFAFLAYNDSDVVPPNYEASADKAGTAFMRVEKMRQAISMAKTQADFVIVSMHSGVEYVLNPNERQTQFARAAIDAGAELVIGHHPHVTQPIEKYKGKYIFYSLGNFVFDQMWSHETRRGAIMEIAFNKNGVKSLKPYPILIHNYSQPDFATGKDASDILERLNFKAIENDFN